MRPGRHQFAAEEQYAEKGRFQKKCHEATIRLRSRGRTAAHA
jgi:hypothetical protein